jgi:hypothetical protein
MNSQAAGRDKSNRQVAGNNSADYLDATLLKFAGEMPFTFEFACAETRRFDEKRTQIEKGHMPRIAITLPVLAMQS